MTVATYLENSEARVVTRPDAMNHVVRHEAIMCRPPPTSTPRCERGDRPACGSCPSVRCTEWSLHPVPTTARLKSSRASSPIANSRPATKAANEPQSASSLSATAPPLRGRYRKFSHRCRCYPEPRSTTCSAASGRATSSTRPTRFVRSTRATWPTRTPRFSTTSDHGPSVLTKFVGFHLFAIGTRTRRTPCAGSKRRVRGRTLAPTHDLPVSRRPVVDPHRILRYRVVCTPSCEHLV
jgi:hypothetical protein